MKPTSVNMQSFKKVERMVLLRDHIKVEVYIDIYSKHFSHIKAD